MTTTIKEFTEVVFKYKTDIKIAEKLWITREAVYARRKRLRIKNIENLYIVSNKDINQVLWRFIIKDEYLIQNWKEEQYSRIKKVFNGESVDNVFDVDEAIEVGMSVRHFEKFLQYCDIKK